MAYLGNDLQVAYPSYRVIDDISSGFNGVLKTFALRVAGSTPIPFPINPQQCLLSVNSVIQKPDSTGASGFTLTGSNIVFATAPTAGWTFFGTVLAGADYVNVGANFPAGTAAVPSVTFDESTGTGLFLASSNVLGIATSGVQQLTVDSNGNVSVTGAVSSALGTAAIPAYRFTGDPNTGIYSPGADQLALATNGVQRLTVDTAAITSTLPVVGPLGAVATPSVTFTGDLNTGIYSPGADQLAISTGGTGRVFVDASGRVGIGTSSPDGNLTIGGLTNTGGQSVDAININRTDGLRLFGVKWDVTSNEVRFSGNTKNYVFRNGSSEAETVRIDSSGRVGIGSSSPVATNHIRGSGTSGQVTASWLLENASSGTVGMDVTGAAGSSILRFLYGGGPSTGTNALTPALTIGVEGAAAGRVGIGTTSPSSSLVVSNGGANGIEFGPINGDIFTYNRSTSAYTNTLITCNEFVVRTNGSTERARIDSSGRVGIGTSSPNGSLDINNGSAVFSNSGTYIGGIGRANGLVAGGTTSQVAITTSGANALLLGTADTERARIDSSGRLLVGSSTAPGSGELLRVEKASTGTEGAGIRFGGTYTIADAGTQTITVGNGALVFVSENSTGDGALFFCGYKSATVTLVADPNSRYANTVTAGRISLTKSANSLDATLTNNSGASRSFTIGKINNGD
jgi:hypothetical protein